MPKKKQVVEPTVVESTVVEPTVVEATINETVLDVSIPPSSSPTDAPPSADSQALSTLPPEAVKEVKVKAKRKAQPKKIEVKEIIEEKAPEENPNIQAQEETPVVEEPKKKIKVKTLEQVQCDKCEKEVTKRTLRYHHKCPGEVIKTEEQPVKRRVKKETKKEEEQTVVTPKETSSPEKPRLTNTYQERLQQALEKRAHTIQKLASQIV